MVQPLLAARPTGWLRRPMAGPFVLWLLWGSCLAAGAEPGRTASLTLELENSEGVVFVGAMRRWDADGNPLRPVDPKAKIDAPAVEATGEPQSAGRWLMSPLTPGRYDVVILVRDRMRIEGFEFPPVLEFDPFLSASHNPPAEAARIVSQDIAKSPHFENKVSPLYCAGDDKQIRVFLQLLRDEPTSYDAEFGQQVAILRHEVWQYVNRYGVWSKEKRTRVFDRVLAAKNELRRWTWVWEPSLGGVVVGQEPVTLRYRIPGRPVSDQVRGFSPY